MNTLEHQLTEVPTPIRRIFRDPNHQEHFDRFGWVKVPLLSNEEVLEFNLSSREIVSEFKDGFTPTFVMSREVKIKTAPIIQTTFASKIESILLEDYRMISKSLVGKMGYDKGDFPLHQHMSFSDETRDPSSLILWCPFVDTDKSNGNLQVVSGTHRLPGFPRHYTTIIGEDLFYSPSCWRLFEERAEDLPMKAGEGLFFHNSLIHGSPPSRTNNMRLAAAIVLVHAASQPLLYFPEDNGRLAICAVDEEFFLGYRGYREDGNRPEKVLGYIDMPNLEGLEQQVFEIMGLEPPKPSTQAVDVVGKSGILSRLKRLLRSGR